MDCKACVIGGLVWIHDVIETDKDELKVQIMPAILASFIY
jgi:hypothetical protein